jgi:tungstate transport system substrate-binding protein
MKIWQKLLIIAALVTTVTIAGTLAYIQYFSKRRLLVSTTTSLYESGLLDEVEKAFEAKYPIDLQFIPAGTGIALEQAKNGIVDAVLVHAPSQESTFLKDGYGCCRKIIGYNFFTIVGPQSDPAGIAGFNATEALKKIAAYGEGQSDKVWVSRGDNSGTHSKEQSLWKAAKFDYATVSNKTWYASAGAGMGQTLLMAEEFHAYTLSDIATYLKYYEKDHSITLVSFMDQKYELLNVYSVMAVNQTRHSRSSINYADAITFIKYLISDEGQQMIEDFGKADYGQSGRLFHKAAALIKEEPLSPMGEWIRKYAFFGDPLSECPPQYRDSRYPELYS